MCTYFTSQILTMKISSIINSCHKRMPTRWVRPLQWTTWRRTCSYSAPGPEDIPYSFLRHFWHAIGPLLVDSWNYSLTTNQLPPSHKISYLRLIPKAGKDSRRIANLRPITLSNTDHKLVTKTYARKLTDLVKGSIGSEQSDYVPGRLINGNVSAMLTTTDLANEDVNVDGV